MQEAAAAAAVAAAAALRAEVEAEIEAEARRVRAESAEALRRACAPVPSDVDATVLAAAIGAARSAGVRTEDVSAATFKLAQARRWGAASEGLAAALAQPTTESEASLVTLTQP